MKKHIVFICNGNIYRSVIAEECFRMILKKQNVNSLFSISSYGLQGTKGTDVPKHKHLSEYPIEWNAAKPTLQKFDIDIRKHHFKKISEAVVKKADVIIAMDHNVFSSAKNSLLNQFPNNAKNPSIFRNDQTTRRDKRSGQKR